MFGATRPSRTERESLEEEDLRMVREKRRGQRRQKEKGIGVDEESVTLR